MATPKDKGVTAASRYSSLASERASYIHIARKCAKLTLPMLAPEEDRPGKSYRRFRTPAQGVAARGVNNLASKLLLTLFPPNQPIFRYVTSPGLLEKQGQKKLVAEVEEALAKRERAVKDNIETAGDRPVMFSTLKHLVVNGNGLLYLPDEGGAKFYSLSNYAVLRDPMDNLMELVVRESVAPDALAEEFRKRLYAKGDFKHYLRNDQTLDIYTWVRRKGDMWHIHEECAGEVVPGSQGSYPLDGNPWIPLRFNRVEGEDYGRPYVEEYLGDIETLEDLSWAVREGAKAAARILLMVNPNGSTSARAIAEADNGDVIEGSSDDVTVLQMDKYADLRVAYQLMERIEQRLEYAFLLHTSIQRKGERVTAEEIRVMAGELEDALGGVYSVLGQDLQLPYVKVRQANLERDGKLPELPKDAVKPAIVTGVEALGRGHDRQRLVGFIGTIGQALGPEGIGRYINPENLIKRLATADGIDPEGLVKTADEVSQADQMNQLRALIERLGPDAMKLMAQQQPTAQPDTAPAQ